MKKLTYGEDLTLRYLQSQGIRFEREPELPGVAQRVDFVVDHPECGKILLEVKDINNPPPPSGFFDGHKPIRRHIEAGAKKFKNTADYLCGLILVNVPGSFVQLNDPAIMMGAMYGNLGFRIPIDTHRGIADANKIEPIYMVGDGKMIRKTRVQNTRIAAIITIIDFPLWNLSMSKYINTEDGRSRRERADDVMRPEEIGLPPFDARLPGATVWENAVASRKLPKDLFKGEMDAWWEVNDNVQLPTYIGQRRRELDVDGAALEQIGMGPRSKSSN